MKTLLASLLLVATALGALAGYQFSQRRAVEREMANVVVARDAAERRVAELERALAVARAVNAPAVASTPAGAPFTPQLPNETTEAAIQQAAQQERAFVTSILSDPQRREAYLAQHRMLARLQYGDVIKRLDLQPAEVDALIEVFAQRQIANLGRGTEAAAAGETATQQRIAELDQAERADIEKLLGPERAAKLAGYRETLQARAVISPVVQDLELARMPLKPDQVDTLARIFHEQTQELQAKLPPPPLITAESLGRDALRDHTAKVRALQEEHNTKILEAAARTLNEAQLARLRAYLRQQLEIEALGGMLLLGNSN